MKILFAFAFLFIVTQAICISQPVILATKNFIVPDLPKDGTSPTERIKATFRDRITKITEEKNAILGIITANIKSGKISEQKGLQLWNDTTSYFNRRVDSVEKLILTLHTIDWVRDTFQNGGFGWSNIFPARDLEKTSYYFTNSLEAKDISEINTGKLDFSNGVPILNGELLSLNLPIVRLSLQANIFSKKDAVITNDTIIKIDSAAIKDNRMNQLLNGGGNLLLNLTLPMIHYSSKNFTVRIDANAYGGIGVKGLGQMTKTTNPTDNDFPTVWNFDVRLYTFGIGLNDKDAFAQASLSYKYIGGDDSFNNSIGIKEPVHFIEGNLSVNFSNIILLFTYYADRSEEIKKNGVAPIKLSLAYLNP